MQCSYCTAEAIYSAYWHRNVPRPRIYACTDHLPRMIEVAQSRADETRRLSPEVAIDNDDAVMVVTMGRRP